ncbi:hypothetical protein GE09DRAFT_522785 [Coniochaeta sp. 2T2.1]|nr:hypothetical protein GE09DRAFT_522785 [Coniochaeta sp. 2T2.1]
MKLRNTVQTVVILSQVSADLTLRNRQPERGLVNPSDESSLSLGSDINQQVHFRLLSRGSPAQRVTARPLQRACCHGRGTQALRSELGHIPSFAAKLCSDPSRGLGRASGESHIRLRLLNLPPMPLVDFHLQLLQPHPRVSRTLPVAMSLF